MKTFYFSSFKEKFEEKFVLYKGKIAAVAVAAGAVALNPLAALAASPNAANYTAMVGTVSDETTGMSGFVVNISPYVVALVSLAVLAKLALAWVKMGGSNAK